MSLIIEIAGIIALLSFAVMCVYVIIALKDSRSLVQQAVQSLHETVKIVDKIETHLSPTLETANDTLKQATTTIARLDNQLQTIETGLQHFSSVAERIDNLEMQLQNKIEGPLLQAASVVSGVAKAISTFSTVWSKGEKR